MIEVLKEGSQILIYTLETILLLFVILNAGLFGAKAALIAARGEYETDWYDETQVQEVSGGLRVILGVTALLCLLVVIFCFGLLGYIF